MPEISLKEFHAFQKLARQLCGLNLPEQKLTLVRNRLAKRLRHLGLDRFEEYASILNDGGAEAEQRIFIDLITTQETHFFREPDHFAFLIDTVLPARDPQLEFRVWSAAVATGEEAYTIAMVLADKLGPGAWSILASDVSQAALNTAIQAVYPEARSGEIPVYYRSRYLLRGKGSMKGFIRIDPMIRDKVTFKHMNLLQPPAIDGLFDCIFMRNVLIYFDGATQDTVINHVIQRLKSGGFLFLGHSESCSHDRLKRAAPAVLRKI